VICTSEEEAELASYQRKREKKAKDEIKALTEFKQKEREAAMKPKPDAPYAPAQGTPEWQELQALKEAKAAQERAREVTKKPGFYQK
jgi:murein L,D-transpeptidase YcbB/YkuD